jgi:hypothetical protein
MSTFKAFKKFTLSLFGNQRHEKYRKVGPSVHLKIPGRDRYGSKLPVRLRYGFKVT